MEDLRPSLILKTEQTIDLLRKDKERLELQLAEIEPRLEEARAILHMLKAEAIPLPSNRQKPKRKMTNRSDVLEALKLFQDEEFTSADLASVLEITKSAAGQQLRSLLRDGLVIVLKESVLTPEGRSATLWKVA